MRGEALGALTAKKWLFGGGLRVYQVLHCLTP